MSEIGNGEGVEVILRINDAEIGEALAHRRSSAKTDPDSDRKVADLYLGIIREAAAREWPLAEITVDRSERFGRASGDHLSEVRGSEHINPAEFEAATDTLIKIEDATLNFLMALLRGSGEKRTRAFGSISATYPFPER